MSMNGRGYSRGSVGSCRRAHILAHQGERALRPQALRKSSNTGSKLMVDIDFQETEGRSDPD